MQYSTPVRLPFSASPLWYAPLASAAEKVTFTHPAQAIVVGTISGPLTLTRVDGVEVPLSEDTLNALGGVIELQAIAIQSAGCGDFTIVW